MPDRDIKAVLADFDDLLVEHQGFQRREVYVATVREKVRTLYQLKELEEWHDMEEKG